MTKLVLRCVTQGTFVMALIAALSFTPAFAMGYTSSLLRLDAPSSYPRRPGIGAPRVYSRPPPDIRHMLDTRKGK
jgi:hypothetical protein